ncbi:IucA/IucC family protein [Streptomyces sp. NPDC050418]|uniref:IucA/IucC family protein n=1 Tax=Streptomyces sp. NPDC050418 TaxID=3365612 RepID=UPI0037AE2837
MNAYVDQLEHPDAGAAANAAGVENLLRCWIRERNLIPNASGHTLRVDLPASGTALHVPVHYWSPTGWHRLGPPTFAAGPVGAPPLDAVTVAALLSRETAVPAPHPAQANPAGQSGTPATPDCQATEPNAPAAGTAAHTNGTPTTPHPALPSHPVTPWAQPGDGSDLVGRVADSVRRTAEFLVVRRRREEQAGTDLFLTAEQSLVLGHPLHPTPKSREGLSEAEAERYSPEAYGSFALHWMAVDRSVLALDSAWTERGRTVAADQLMDRLAGPAAEQAGAERAAELPEHYALLPVHPWQASDLAHRPEVADLIARGLLTDLGPLGTPWYPTSSVRTVYQPGAPAMLKLSLGLRITNSRRENLHKELHRGVEVHRLLRSGLSAQWQAAHPGFDIVRDPAWLAVVDADGAPVQGLDTVVRNNPFAAADDVTCIAGLVSPRPAPADHGTGAPMRSRLAELVGTLAARTGRPRSAVATEWFLRYLEQVVRPVLWLDGEAGIALEAHQQNTLVVLDADGWPAGGRYRDNQGYYFRTSRRTELTRRLPGIGLHSDTFVADDVTDERFAYYLGINNVLGLIGAFGSQQLADEQLLLAAFRRFLTECAAGSRRLRSPLPAQLLDTPVLRCKANLLTRLHGLDELVGPVDTQSVYVTIANPLHSSRT